MAIATPEPRAPETDLRVIGKPMKRVEDPRLLVGRGGYVEDIELAGMLHAAVLHAPHAHARILSIDTAAALAVPGVVTVLTGEDCKAHMGPCVNFGPDHDRAVPARRRQGPPLRRGGRGRRRGDPLRGRGRRRRARRPPYEPLEAVVDPFKAVEEGAPLVHEAHGSNLAYERDFAFGDVARTFAEADLVVRDRLHWGRSSGTAARDDRRGGDARPQRRPHIHCNSVTFSFCAFLIATALKLPSNRCRLQPVPAGGSFGSKFFAHKVPTLAGFCALRTGRPVRYVEDRLDHLATSDHHGSDRWYDAELAVKRDGTLLGLQIDVIDDYGAFLQFGVGTHGNALSQVAGPYKMQQHPLPPARRPDEQVPAGRLPRIRLRGAQLGARADDRAGRARARHQAGGDPPQELHR